jgi:UDP-N-acetylmuramate: L-alanyl-gamma-D-glutamyl-meso-diaminopimelate ligase
MSPDQLLVAWDDDQNIDELTADKRMRLQRYGLGEDSCWRIEQAFIEPPWNCFEVSQSGQKFGVFKTRVPGEHNRLNALAAIAAASRLGISPEAIAAAFETFAGVKRRQEVRGVKNGVTVMDDFAHHPTAVRETIRAVRPFYPDGRLIAVFEPRTNTSMRDVFQDAYPAAFGVADIICIRQPPMLSKIPEGHRFSSEQLVADLKKQNQDAHYFPDTDAIIAFLSDTAKAGDVILVMSNGGFDGIHDRLLKAL